MRGLGQAGVTLDLTRLSVITAVTRGGHASSNICSRSAIDANEFNKLNSDETELWFSEGLSLTVDLERPISPKPARISESRKILSSRAM
jgi:hypothetical protein